MIPKPLQFLLLAPLAFGPMAPRFVAIAEAVAERLSQRHGKNQHTKEEVENFPHPAEGKTRDLAAAKAGLGSGKTPVLPVLLCDRQRGL